MQNAPFADEVRDLQVALATRVGGRLQRAPDMSRGGYLDRLFGVERWRPEQVVGHVQSRLSERPPGFDPSGDTLSTMVVAGRRVVEIAEDRSGMLTGWHDRVRAWWGDGDGLPSTLLGLGICELTSVFRGDTLPFRDWFAATRGPAHVVHVPDHVLAPSAPVLLDQCRRTAADAQAIREDFTRTLAAHAPTPDDWMFASALVSALLRSPLTEPLTVLRRDGLRTTRGPDAVVLSLNSEPSTVLRHKSLGYALTCHGFRANEAGAAVKAWMRHEFETVKRSVGDIRRDIEALAVALGDAGVGAVLVVNMLSTTGGEDVQCYAPFDAPLSATLGSVRAKELNLMLHDVARTHGVSIVDNDAIAADLGAGIHLGDGVHNSGALQAALRADILRLLRERGVAGFAPA
jgi:hypothetical protein